jgi:hypothetical protein
MLSMDRTVFFQQNVIQDLAAGDTSRLLSANLPIFIGFLEVSSDAWPVVVAQQ